MKILIVDDSPLMHKVYMSRFKEKGSINPVFCNNGADALDKLKEQKDFEIVVCDLNMPQMNGLEFVEKVKKSVLLSRIPILAITAEGNEENARKAVKMGASDFLIKPFDFEKFFMMVDRATGRM